ncbi:hypothetical protein G647_03907 [Cladophialophora carrionii CBS 160.54]|uniref:trans-L-3-hydroxyproline dehydratase n=1 Tax=Cladophialophora carrionii CBS 160.54 TaxID=1279043 RepID=V9DDY2_9EURO|nr:uncharacterized protein G647_03907 [Cladophialophora carrionii CBS 160.54]ETI24538.1 hypothetical protein G647_03907 [Cladophialophora carrionii CBS 160.54]
MDIARELSRPEYKPIFCIEMHTCGEPTRIVIDGYPNVTGTLLEQRTQARQTHDHIRKRLMLEPRGHYDMYGAVLRPDTELTQLGQAHMGVLFMTNDGYSTMCGHATIALGRFLLDTHDLNIFPRRNDIIWDRKSLIADLNIHAPCGLLRLSVPVSPDGRASDPSKPVSFVSVPSFATGLQVPLAIAHPWPQLERKGAPKTPISVDFAYGGAFYAVVDASSLGFKEHLQDIDMRELSRATESLLLSIREQPKLTSYYQHPEESDLSFLYGVIVTDSVLREGKPVPNAELGVCFFADQQIDRSPTGSGVAAREALAYCKGERSIGTAWSYHSLVSNRDLGPPFVGTIEMADGSPKQVKTAQVHVRVSGQAFYSGSSTFSVEQEDPLGDSGFVFTKLTLG